MHAPSILRCWRFGIDVLDYTTQVTWAAFSRHNHFLLIQLIVAATSLISGAVTGNWLITPISRAIPRMLKQSPRFQCDADVNHVVIKV